MGIEFVAVATASATTLTMPAHQAGDVLIMLATRSGNATPPTVPAGWTSMATRNQSALVSAVVAYKIASSSSETSGTWTNASVLQCHSYRPDSPVGAALASAANGATPGMTWPDMSPFFDVMCYVRFSFKVGGTAVVSLAGWTPRGGSSNVLYGGEALVGNVAASTVGANAYTATSAVGWVTFTVAFGVPASASDRFFQFL